MSVVQNSHAAALFDVGDCFEALSEAQGGQEVFPGSSHTSDNPFRHGHNYTHTGIRIHLHTQVYSSTYRHVRDADMYTVFSDVSCAWRELALLKSNCTQANNFFFQCQLVVGSDVAVCATQLAVVTST